MVSLFFRVYYYLLLYLLYIPFLCLFSYNRALNSSFLLSRQFIENNISTFIKVRIRFVYGPTVQTLCISYLPRPDM